jgi:type IV pilus assembly protein PilB
MNRYSDFKIDSDFCRLCLKERLVPLEIMNQAITTQKTSERSLVDILVADHGIDEKKLYEQLSVGLGFPYQELQSFSVGQEVISKIPIKVASHYHFMPLKIEGSTLAIAVEYPLNIKTLDEIRMQLGYNIVQVLSRGREITSVIKNYYGFAANTVDKIVSHLDAETVTDVSEGIPIEQIDKMAGDASVINLVSEILYDAFGKRATDVHLEPYRGQFRLRYRIDGVLYDMNLSGNARQLILPILSRIKIMANLNIVERRLPQDGRAVVKVKDQNLDLRVSSIPTAHGESIVIRILPTQMIFDLKKLGLSDKNVEMLEILIRKPHGIVLLTGPTGSGKTTTLYACLNRLSSKTNKIITIEDPVEYEIPGITQIQVVPKVGLDFARGLRSMLRHDPDIMMVGEIRDFETAEIAIRAALTGHLVFSTLHTNDAASGFARLLDIGVEPFLVASSVEAIIAQRLVRMICPKCKVEDEEQPKALKQRIAAELGLKPTAEVKLYKGSGCDYCNRTGFLGRTALHEILLMSDSAKQLVVRKASGHDIKIKAVAEGMETLLKDGWRKIVAGVTTVGEVLNVTDIGSEEVSAEWSAPDETTQPNEAQKNYQDKRVYTRINATLEVMYREVEVRYRPWDVKAQKPQEGEGERSAYTENISAGGILMKVKESLPLGSILELRFKILRQEAREIRCLARVMRIEESLEKSFYYTGVMFLDLPTADRVFVNEYVRVVSGGVFDA